MNMHSDNYFERKCNVLSSLNILTKNMGSSRNKLVIVLKAQIHLDQYFIA